MSIYSKIPYNKNSIRIYYIKGTESPQFDDITEWLIKNVGKSKKDWYFSSFGTRWLENKHPYIQYDFLRKKDAIAFKLRYDINGISHIGPHWNIKS